MSSKLEIYPEPDGTFCMDSPVPICAGKVMHPSRRTRRTPNESWHWMKDANITDSENISLAGWFG